MIEVTVTMADVRTAKLCSRGARAWFIKYELSWQSFLIEGLPAAVVEGTGDYFAQRVARIARARVTDHG